MPSVTAKKNNFVSIIWYPISDESTGVPEKAGAMMSRMKDRKCTTGKCMTGKCRNLLPRMFLLCMWRCDCDYKNWEQVSHTPHCFLENVSLYCTTFRCMFATLRNSSKCRATRSDPSVAHVTLDGPSGWVGPTRWPAGSARVARS